MNDVSKNDNDIWSQQQNNDSLREAFQRVHKVHARYDELKVK